CRHFRCGCFWSACILYASGPTQPGEGDAMTGAGSADDSDQSGEEGTADTLDAELVRLRRLIVASMDRLAEEVLDQIQTTRSMADETESLLHKLRGGPITQDTDESANHLRHITEQIVKAMRGIPESSWDAYVDMCLDLVWFMRGVHDAADGREVV